MTLRWNWGTGIALVYSAFAAATIGFVVFAMNQDVELVSADYYQRGLQHDRQAAAELNGAALGAGVRVDVHGREVRILWNAARPNAGDGSITLYRPSDAGADRVAPVAPDADGRQRVSLSHAPTGRWIVRMAWRAGGRDYFVERAVITQ